MGAILNRVFVVDIEATCWETREEQGKMPNEVIEIGICTLDVRSGKIDDVSSYVVKPRFTKVTPFCTQLTGWTQAEIDGGADIVPTLAAIAKDYNFGKGNVWFSCGEYDRVKLASDPNMGGSLGALYADVEAEWTKNQNTVVNPFQLARHFNIKTLFALKYKLSKEMGMDRMLKHIGETLEGRHHNGADDAANIAKIVRKVLA